MITLFTTKTCSQCPIVIQELDSKGVEYEKLDAEDSPDRAAEHGIMSVPTIVYNDEVHAGAGACLSFINEHY